MCVNVVLYIELLLVEILFAHHLLFTEGTSVGFCYYYYYSLCQLLLLHVEEITMS